MTVFLVDNGSLRPESTRSLRVLATTLSRRTGLAIEPVSLLHSNRVAPSALDGRPAEIFDPAIRARHATGERRFLVIPLFFGPTRAITRYVPDKRQALERVGMELEIVVAAPLADPDHPEDIAVLERILLDHVNAELPPETASEHRTAVVLVDHGTPVRAVNAVRNRLAERLGKALEGRRTPVSPASMERRPGPAYAFNEPLLEQALRELPPRITRVVVAMLFLQPGRHAGAGGDVDAICRDAMRERPHLDVRMTRLVGEHPALIDLLERKLRRTLPAAGTSTG